MTPHNQNPLPERVAVLEAILPIVRNTLLKFDERLGNQEAAFNKLMLQLSSVIQTVKGITDERSRWKDPMLYVTIAAVVISGLAVYFAN